MESGNNLNRFIIYFSNRKQFIEHEQKEIKLQTKLLVKKCGIP